MDESSVKESRVILRQIQDHLLAAQALAGVIQESAGMVDVIYHPVSPLPRLNVVIPRRNTAWVPVGAIEQGLRRLRELNRQPRFQYIEGLFPPQFAETLKKIDLQPESARPLFAFKRGIGGLPTGQRARRVDAGRGQRLWASAQEAGWRMPVANPLLPADGETQPAYDLVAYQDRAPVAILRVEIQPQIGVAHFTALAHRAGSDDLTAALLAAGVRSALRHGGALVFAMPESDALAASLTDLHFVELGRLVCYELARSSPELEQNHGHLAQSVLAGH